MENIPWETKAQGSDGFGITWKMREYGYAYSTKEIYYMENIQSNTTKDGYRGCGHGKESAIKNTFTNLRHL